MARFTTINAATLFNPRNNSSRRMDAGFAFALQTLTSGGGENPHNTAKGLFKSDYFFRRWCLALRKLTNLQDVEDHISLVLTGSKIMRPPYRASLTTDYSPEVRAGIRKMAIALCEAEAGIAESEIADQLAHIQTLRQLAAAHVRNRNSPKRSRPPKATDRLQL